MWDIGRTLSWAEFRSLIRWMPTQDSALFRARFPHSWWWTPEMDMLSRIEHALRGANWQRARSKSDPPEPITKPEDAPAKVKTAADLAEKRRAQREHLAARRGQEANSG